MARLATDNLADLISKKHQLLFQLRDIGRRQQQLVDGNPHPLLQLLAAKQHLISGLQLVERHLRPFQSDDPEARVWRSAQERERTARLADECGDLLAEVMQQERDQERVILERRNQVAAQLRQVDRAHQAADAYRQHRADGPPAPPPLASFDSTRATLPLDSPASSR